MESGAIAFGAAQSDAGIGLSFGDKFVSIPLKDVKFDTGNYFAVDGKVHIKQDGIYVITGEVSYDYQKNATGSRWAIIRRNGNDDEINYSSTSPTLTTAGSTPIVASVLKLVQNEYLELMGQISSEGTVSTSKILKGKFSIARLGDT